ncbi:hypothetical protein FSARC_4809 [Fusarium sarcochroum]|uniref:Glutamine amidotransferase type-2 domain-containing protein n=1 Tax=Fusarium sarcochroum TaxID=1208366 RepID=A0A8H4U1A9_9HYPO|nr:hypothetical protein FSARC_4809 [Fusarium sarcochroum]
MCGFIASILLSDDSRLQCFKAKNQNGGKKNGSRHKSPTNGFSNGTVQKASAVNGNGNIHEKTTTFVLNGNSSGKDGRKILETKLLAGLDNISHRGPDSYGTWISQSNTVAFGHCRLSLNDLTALGRQPLHSHDRLVHAVVNGEIYEYDRLRQLCIDRIDYQFQGHSDSELVLALYKLFGAPSFLTHLRGEFSFVLYDEDKQVVIAGRDRYGIKPLFWTVVEEVSANGSKERRMLFASEAKAFLPLGWKPEWDTESLASGAFNYDDQRTIFKDVQKVRPGHILTVDAEGVAHHQYWDMQYRPRAKQQPGDDTSIENQSPSGIEDCITRVREELVESIKLRLSADVPVGIYLSGGLDSSAVAGIASHLRKQQSATNGNGYKQSGMECFCISFDGRSGFDELEVAQRTADHLGFHLNHCKMDETMLADHFEATTWHNERHCLDLGTIGKYCLSRTVQDTGYKAILTGEGADEIFGGYPWFLVDMFERVNSVQSSENPLSQSSLLFEKVREAIVSRFKQMMGPSWDPETASPELLSEIGHDYGFIASIMWGSAEEILKPQLRKSLDDKIRVLLESLPKAGRKHLAEGDWHPLHASLYVWNKTQLANFILTAECDRTEMSHSVEGRVPFLDHHLTEFVDSLSPGLKILHDSHNQVQEDDSPWWSSDNESGLRQFREKWLLREATRPFLTDEVYNRRKHLYTAPATWPHGGPLWKRFAKLVTRENAENLGFVSWTEVEPLLDTAFGERGSHRAFRNLISVAAWVVLGQRFGIPRATV